MATARQDTLTIRDKNNHSDRWMDLPHKSWPTLHESIAKGMFKETSWRHPTVDRYALAYRKAGWLTRNGLRKFRGDEYLIGNILYLKDLIRNRSLGEEARRALSTLDYCVLSPGRERHLGYFGYDPRVINGVWSLPLMLTVAEAMLDRSTGSAISEGLEAIPAFAASPNNWLTVENGLRLSWIVETTKSPGCGFVGRFEFPELVSTALGYLALNKKSDPNRDLPAFMDIVDAVTVEPLEGRWGAFMPLRSLVVNENFNPETDLPAFLQTFERLNSAASAQETGPVFDCLQNAVSNSSFEPAKSFPLFASVIEGITKNVSGDERVKAMDAFFSFVETARKMGIRPLQFAADLAAGKPGSRFITGITALDLLMTDVPYEEALVRLSSMESIMRGV